MASQIQNPSSLRHIAVLAFPFGTHASPLLSLARALSTAVGSNVNFSFFATDSVNRSLFPDGIAGKVTPFEVGDGIPADHAPSGSPIEAVELFLESAAKNFSHALAAAERKIGFGASCIVSDAFFWFAGDLAAERGVPWFALWTAAPRSLLVHLATDEIRRRCFEVEEENLSRDQILDFLPGFSGIREADLPEGVLINLSKDASESPFARTLHKMGQALPRAEVVLINSFHGIDPEISDHLKSRLKSFLNIGPFTLTTRPINNKKASSEDKHGCLEWLSSHEPGSVVYISFGSVAALPPHEAEAVRDALEEAGIPFLWSFRGMGFSDRPGLRSGLVVPWAPQEEVLRHEAVGAFVTHCGWNSVLESVIGGIPMICRPFFGDQGLNSRTVEAVWEIGIEVRVLTKESFVAALRKVFSGENVKGIRERVCELKRLAYEEAVGNQDFSSLVELISSRSI